jgi:rubrerythrin
MERVVLERIAADRGVEARWLHTVSLLEFVGARKIMRTVAARHPRREVLEHVADETRHALAFKALAERLAERPMGDAQDDYLCRDAALTYFQRLDKGAAALVEQALGARDEEACYLVTTTLIERRAMRLYPLYRSITTHDFIKAELKAVILEEASHRKALEKAAEAKLASAGLTDWSALDGLERALWAELEGAMAQVFGVTAAP